MQKCDQCQSFQGFAVPPGKVKRKSVLLAAQPYVHMLKINI